jgi:hypothetical protein
MEEHFIIKFIKKSYFFWLKIIGIFNFSFILKNYKIMKIIKFKIHF